MSDTINLKEIGEWVIDLLGSFAVYWVASSALMDSEASVASQPLSFFASLGITFAGFKLLRQWKALS